MRVRRQTGTHTHTWIEVPEPRRGRCRHLGPETGATVGCGSCPGKVALKVLACAQHQRCTLASPAPGLACCTGCPDFSPLPEPEIEAPPETYMPGSAVQFDAGEHMGLGDHLIQLTIATGYKDAHPDLEVLITGYADWSRLWDSGCRPVRRLVHGVPRLRALDGKYAHWHRYDGRSPWECCAAEVGGIMPRIPPLRPLPAAVEEWAARFRGAIVLAPFTARPIRTWPISHWLRLEELLRQAGYACVILDDRQERCRPFTSPKLIGEAPERVAGLLRAAALMVANESGAQHIAGMVGTPALVMASVFPNFTDLYPGHQVLSGNLGCEWCRQQDPPRPGWPSRAEIGCVTNDHGRCASLASITPERVFAEVRQRAQPAPECVGQVSNLPDQDGRLETCPTKAHKAPLVADPVIESKLRGHLARLVVPNPTPVCPLLQADRRLTMRAMLRRIVATPDPLVIETGCQRAELDYGAGMSSTIFGLCLKTHGGRLISLDNSPAHVDFCRSMTRGLPVELVLTDSRDWLRDYAGPAIDALYLDSQDTTDPGFEECCLTEARLALPHLAPQAVILIDDTWREGDAWGGKGTVAVPWLLSQGWRVLLDRYQVLLGRGV